MSHINIGEDTVKIEYTCGCVHEHDVLSPTGSSTILVQCKFHAAPQLSSPPVINPDPSVTPTPVAGQWSQEDREAALANARAINADRENTHARNRSYEDMQGERGKVTTAYESHGRGWRDGRAFEATVRTNPDYVDIPTNVAQAELMEKLGYQYLEQYAPERLRKTHGESFTLVCGCIAVTHLCNEHDNAMGREFIARHFERPLSERDRKRISLLIQVQLYSCSLEMAHFNRREAGDDQLYDTILSNLRAEEETLQQIQMNLGVALG